VPRIHATPREFAALATVRCPECRRTDVFALPVTGVVDLVAWAAFFGPFKCRACHRKFYRRIQKLETED
jgi:hypothetical protein